MLWSGNELRGWHLRASDETLGEVEDLLFDDRSWAVRYLVADTSRWLPGRTVLIAPEALDRPQPDSGQVPVHLTAAQVRDSPAVTTHAPVNLRMERRMRAYYGWAPYFGGHNYDGGGGAVPPGQRPDDDEDDDDQDAHLRSLHAIEGYEVRARDGTAGHVKDLQFDDEGWNVRFVVIDCGGWITGKPVRVAPAAIRAISWSEREVSLDLSVSQILESPGYDPAART